jgi:hypothetical protein
MIANNHTKNNISEDFRIYIKHRDIIYRRMLPGLIYFGYYALQQFLIKKCSI